MNIIRTNFIEIGNAIDELEYRGMCIANIGLNGSVFSVFRKNKQRKVIDLFEPTDLESIEYNHLMNGYWGDELNENHERKLYLNDFRVMALCFMAAMTNEI